MDQTNHKQQDCTYFDLTNQFQEDYVSNRLREFSAYYSNRLSYSEVAGLVERVTGVQQLSDQKIRQIVVNKAVAVGQVIQCQVEESIKKETMPFPKIASEIAIYHRGSREILVFEDAIQVRGQKENRDTKQNVIKKPMSHDVEKTKTPVIQTDIVMLEKKEGGFEYLTALIDDHGNDQVSLPDLLRSRVIQEYGMEKEPLPIVAITDGAKVIRQHLNMVFGVALVIILDWYHLGKKVRDLMSMIAPTKEDKQRYLKFIFYHLWQGHIDTVLDYLKNTVEAKNEEKRVELITYLEKHKTEIIDYDRRKKAGKSIGSGYIEKGCDQTIGHRQKKKGMSWQRVGSKSLGILKVIELNNQWQKLWFPKEAANDPYPLRLVANS
jgi:hypothetical protein